MGIFNKKENELTKKLTEAIEKQNDVLSVINSSLFEQSKFDESNTLAAALEQHVKVIENIGDRAFPIKEKADTKLAAYALNLCLVSISQIIDYNDLIVLEQEYDNILNNLNLENMPKDDALLDILKQILDTISFFRIQESDKKFIEIEYQRKMKNAIWSAVPSISVFLSSSNPAHIALTLATQIGTGYMNYRRTRSENELEKDKQLYELQKSAMEQFHGLRRELFTTAWRLVDEYGIPEEMRLTEKQITEYNDAIMLLNPYRRFATLEMMAEENFKAYPQINYYLAHTALQIAEEHKDIAKSHGDRKEEYTQISKEYTKTAKEYFEKYFDFFKSQQTTNGERIKNLLREDNIYASAAFEYAQICEKEEDKKRYLEKAVKNSGKNYDIMQMIAMSYIEIKEIDTACNLLKKLVLAGYNADANTEILAMLYIRQYLNGHDEKYKKYFESLSKYTGIDEIIAFPSQEEDKTNIENNFLYQKRLLLIRLYKSFANGFYYNKSAEYNRISKLKTKKECELVNFLTTMRSEFAELKETGLIFGSLEKIANDHFNTKHEKSPWQDKPEEELEKFDEVFKNSFVDAFNDLKIEYKTLGGISLIETILMKYMSKYSSVHQDDTDGKITTIGGFCGDNEILPENFKNIKAKIEEKKDTIEKNLPRNFELIIHDSARYEAYMRKHNFRKEEVVAILDGKKGNNDLLFTINGLCVRTSNWRKTGKIIGAIAVSVPSYFTPWGLTTSPIGFKLLHSVLPNSVYYNEIKFDENNNNLTNPKYTFPEEIRENLKPLIDELKELFSNNLLEGIIKKLKESENKVKKIHENFLKIKEQTEKNINELKRLEFREVQNEEDRKLLIEASANYLKTYDLGTYLSIINGILQNQPHSTIEGYIKSITTLVQDK